MTRTLKHIRSRSARSRIVALAAAVTTVGATLGMASVAQAAPRTESAGIASEARLALDALDRWRVTENPVDFAVFVHSRDTTAVMVAYDLEVDIVTMRSEWAHVDIAKQQALLAALSQLGVPYRHLASKAGVGFDCSGLTSYAYDQAGINIERSSGNQINEAATVALDEAEPGDLVYYPGHVSLYLGVETMVHSPNSGNQVEAAHLPDRELRFGDVLDGDAPANA